MWPDNSHISRKYEIPSGETAKKVLSILTSLTVGKLIEQHKGLLIFPKEPSGDIANSTVLRGNYSNADDHDIYTTNIMGVISYSNDDKQEELVTISIGSRFDSSEKQNFFIYLLSQVFDFNIVDWKSQASEAKLCDILLVFLFVHHLEKAYRQGLFKQYVLRRYNEYSFKGALDVQTHIKRNVPFTGKVAYKFKEMSYDNPVLHLIRYTTDYVHNKYENLWRGVLANKWTVNEAARVIREATPSYTIQNRLKIYQTSLKPIRHPFYTEYDALRKICKRILRNEGLNVYSGTEERVYGVLFDGAWLWECYISKLLEPLGFKHLVYPDDREVFAFDDGPPLYPDFYNEKDHLVFDAKYKRWDEKNEEDKREDILQILAYMYVTRAEAGGIIFPKAESYKETRQEIRQVWKVRKPFYVIPFGVPQTVEDSFLDQIHSEEERIKRRMKEIQLETKKSK